MFREIHVSYPNITNEEAFEQRRFRVFVVGIARSGTSLLSNICRTLGVNWFYHSEDEESVEMREKDFDLRYRQEGDRQYDMNPDGFYEIGSKESNVFVDMQSVLSTQYGGCKLILPYGSLMDATLRFGACRVLLTERDPQEIVSSWRAAYTHGQGHVDNDEEWTPKQEKRWRKAEKLLGFKLPRKKATKATEEEQAHFFASVQANAEIILQNLTDTIGVQVMKVPHRDMMEKPDATVKGIAEFINAPNIGDAVKLVKPELHRHRNDGI